jgi:hypothetical protein
VGWLPASPRTSSIRTFVPAAVRVTTIGSRTIVLHLDETDLRRFWESPGDTGLWTTVLDEASGLLWDLTWRSARVPSRGDGTTVEGFTAHARVSRLNAR